MKQLLVLVVALLMLVGCTGKPQPEHANPDEPSYATQRQINALVDLLNSSPIGQLPVPAGSSKDLAAFGNSVFQSLQAFRGATFQKPDETQGLHLSILNDPQGEARQAGLCFYSEHTNAVGYCSQTKSVNVLHSVLAEDLAQGTMAGAAPIAVGYGDFIVDELDDIMYQKYGNYLGAANALAYCFAGAWVGVLLSHHQIKPQDYSAFTNVLIWPPRGADFYAAYIDYGVTHPTVGACLIQSHNWHG